MADQVYTSVPLEVRRDEAAGLYIFGAVIEGTFVRIGVRKLGGVDADIQRTREQAAAQAPPSQPQA